MTVPHEDYGPSERYTSGIDGESDFESEDYEAARRTPRYPSGLGGRRQPGRSGYYNGPTSPTAVTQAQLRSVLQKVQEDIGRVADGVRTTNNNLNDLNTRSARNFAAQRAEVRRSATQQARATEDVKQLAIMSALLGGDGTDMLVPLLALGMAGSTPTVDGTPAPAGMGGDMTALLAIAIASGGLGKKP
ncbi:hypothetical protein ACRAWF_31500 [Streptomyces sp. L7]